MRHRLIHNVWHMMQGEAISSYAIDFQGIPVIRHSRAGGNPVAVRGHLHIPLDSRLRGSDDKDSLTEKPDGKCRQPASYSQLLVNSNPNP